jgi:hypothetical protein
VAKVALVGSWTAVIVTGYGFGLEIVTTTSPVPPGYIRFVADGDATALIVRFEIEADWPSPEDPEFSPTTQFVAAYAPTPARRMPHTADTIFVRRVYRKALLSCVARCTGLSPCADWEARSMNCCVVDRRLRDRP